MFYRILLFSGIIIFLAGCLGNQFRIPDDFIYVPVNSGKYNIVTYQKLSDSDGPIRIYIEGDGTAFNALGQPTSDPTPRGTMIRDMVARDAAPNVVYIARPCQFIKSSECSVSDWTSGRFSADVVDATADVIRTVANKRQIVLIGYSGGAILSALIITRHPDLNVHGWITIAGVLNHSDWTEYFGDTPLNKSLPVDELPRISDCHYVAENDKVVPRSLSVRWLVDRKMIVVPNSEHDDFGEMIPNCLDIE